MRDGMSAWPTVNVNRLSPTSAHHCGASSVLLGGDVVEIYWYLLFMYSELVMERCHDLASYIYGDDL